MDLNKWLVWIGMALTLIGYFSKPKLKKIIIGIGIVLMILPLLVPRNFWGTSDLIKSVNGKEVAKIVLAPNALNWKVNLTEQSFVITDKNKIDSVLYLLRRVENVFVNHPLRIWQTDLTLFTTDNDSMVFKIVKTSNNGTLVTSQGAEFRKDKLGKLLEGFTNFTSPTKAKGN